MRVAGAQRGESETRVPQKEKNPAGPGRGRLASREEPHREGPSGPCGQRGWRDACGLPVREQGPPLPPRGSRGHRGHCPSTGHTYTAPPRSHCGGRPRRGTRPHASSRSGRRRLQHRQDGLSVAPRAAATCRPDPEARRAAARVTGDGDGAAVGADPGPTRPGPSQQPAGGRAPGRRSETSPPDPAGANGFHVTKAVLKAEWSLLT